MIGKNIYKWQHSFLNLMAVLLFVISNCPPAAASPFQSLYGHLNVSSLLNTSPTYAGPNCFNFSLYLRGILPYVRMVSQEEISYWMKSPLCSKVSDIGSIRPGDIGLIQDRSNSEIHSFLINQGNVLTKNGPEIENPYQESTFDEVMKFYEVNPRECGLPGSQEKSCPLYTEFFRCKSLDEFLSASQVSKPLLNILNEFHIFERKLQDYLIFDRRQIGDLSKEAQVLGNRLISLLKSCVVLTESDKLIAGSLSVRLQSYCDQFNQFNDQGNAARDSSRLYFSSKGLLEETPKQCLSPKISSPGSKK